MGARFIKEAELETGLEACGAMAYYPIPKLHMKLIRASSLFIYSSLRSTHMVSVLRIKV